MLGIVGKTNDLEGQSMEEGTHSWLSERRTARYTRPKDPLPMSVRFLNSPRRPPEGAARPADTIFQLKTPSFKFPPPLPSPKTHRPGPAVRLPVTPACALQGARSRSRPGADVRVALLLVGVALTFVREQLFCQKKRVIFNRICSVASAECGLKPRTPLKYCQIKHFGVAQLSLSNDKLVL